MARRSRSNAPREIQVSDTVALPTEGTAPKLVRRAGPATVAAPQVVAGEAVVNSRTYAAIRGLKDHAGSFVAECNRAGHAGRQPLSAWDRIYNEYMNRPVRG